MKPLTIDKSYNYKIVPTTTGFYQVFIPCDKIKKPFEVAQLKLEGKVYYVDVCYKLHHRHKVAGQKLIGEHYSFLCHDEDKHAAIIQSLENETDGPGNDQPRTNAKATPAAE